MTNSTPHTASFKVLKTISAKRKARRFAMQNLYEWQMHQKPIHEVEAYTRTENAMHKVDIEYYHDLIHGVANQIEIIDSIISKHSEWDWQSVSGVEKAILRMSVFELKERFEVPYKVVIDEAVELAKEFAHEDSHRFVNGILDKLLIELRPIECAHKKA